MRTTKPKIVVIGAGSASFGLSNLGAIMRTGELHGSTLALCDLNKEGLSEIRKLAERINTEWDCGMTVMASTNREELLAGADFIILSVAIDREKCWMADHELGKKYGITHYAENGGLGGFFHAARNITLLMPVFRDIERLAPDALILNFTNPVTRICTAAARYTKLKMVGICHQIDFGYMMAGRILGKKLGLSINHDYYFRWNGDPEEKRIATLARERLDVKAAGLNHFTWFLSIRDKKTGEELLSLFQKLFLEQSDFEPYTRAIIETFGTCPTSGDAHFLEYLPYTSNINRGGWVRYGIQMYPLKAQSERREAMWSNIVAMSNGTAPVDALRNVHTERAETMIAALWEGSDLYDYAVNIPNTNGYISNLPREAIVEVPAVLGLHGIQGVAVGDLPVIPAAFCSRQVDIVELAIKSIVEGDKQLALQTLALDPMIDDLGVAKAMLDDGLMLFEKYLPQFKA